MENADKQTVKVVSTILVEGKSGFSALHTATYTIDGDATVKIDNDLKFSGLRINPARIGLRMMVNQKLDSATYFGRGPVENYSDRKEAADVGIYTLGVNNQYEYEKPMDRGNHEDVRWIQLHGKNTSALKIKSDANLMQFTALPHTDEQMAPVAYKIDLPKSNATVVCVSTKTVGVGSYSCGPEPLDLYKIWTDNTQFSFTLQLK